MSEKVTPLRDYPDDRRETERRETRESAVSWRSGYMSEQHKAWLGKIIFGGIALLWQGLIGLIIIGVGMWANDKIQDRQLNHLNDRVDLIERLSNQNNKDILLNTKMIERNRSHLHTHVEANR